MFEPDACYSKTNQDHTFLLRLWLVRASSMSYLCHPPPLSSREDSATASDLPSASHDKSPKSLQANQGPHG